MQTSGETMQLITMQHLKHKICCENNVTLECFLSIFFLFECTHDKDIERCTKLKVDKTKDCDHTVFVFKTKTLIKAQSTA